MRTTALVVQPACLQERICMLHIKRVACIASTLTAAAADVTHDPTSLIVGMPASKTHDSGG